MNGSWGCQPTPVGIAAWGTGLVVPPEDSEALADAMQYVLFHPDKASHMGEAGRRRVEEDSSIETMMTQHIAVYDSLVAAHSAGASSLGRSRPSNGGSPGE